MTWKCTVIRDSEGIPVIIRLDDHGRQVALWDRVNKTWQSIEENVWQSLNKPWTHGTSVT